MKGRIATALAALALLVPVVGSAPAMATSPSSPVSIRADVNRDGRVDLIGSSDERGEAHASAGRGALFLSNIDDDSLRCAETAPFEQSCNDASDDVVNGARDARDLATVRTVPMTALGAGAFGTVTEGEGGAHTRLFVDRGDHWTRVTSATRFTAGQLRRGLKLGLEGKDIIRDTAAWDGEVTLRLTVTERADSRSDRVALRVAPLLTHTHLQPTEQIVAAPGGDTEDTRFMHDLQRASRRVGVPEPVLNLGGHADRWIQDWLEPMYAKVPSKGGAQRMRVMVRSDQNRPAQESLFSLRGEDVAVVQLGDRGAGGTFSSLGNLETIPHYSHRGKHFPAGRMIYGVGSERERPSAATLRMLKSQGVQSPLALDTGWLRAGHVDEYVQFVPADNARGWTIAIADPLGAVRLLRQTKAQGHGEVNLSSHPDFGEKSISEFLADERLRRNQVRAATHIDRVLGILQRKTGVKDHEVIEVPGLYTSKFGDGGRTRSIRDVKRGRVLAGATSEERREAESKPTARRQQAALADPGEMSSLLPAAINSVVVSPRHVIVAKQFGPVIGGKDLFAIAVRKAYGSVGIHAVYIDDYTTYHRLGGEVHCATNTLRAPTPKWW